MYPVYQTTGVVLKSVPQGESNRLFYVYTRDFGLICVIAQSVRKMTSKLRFHLEEYSLLSLELVRGREFWRPKAAEKIESYRGNPAAVARIAALVLRLCDLEEKNELLFQDLTEGFSFFSKKEIDAAALEAVLVLRILARLGYVGAENLLSFVNTPLHPEILPMAREKLSFVVTSVNQLLKEI
jgi:DNA repair protein RecO